MSVPYLSSVSPPSWISTILYWSFSSVPSFSSPQWWDLWNLTKWYMVPPFWITWTVKESKAAIKETTLVMGGYFLAVFLGSFYHQRDFFKEVSINVVSVQKLTRNQTNPYYPFCWLVRPCNWLISLEVPLDFQGVFAKEPVQKSDRAVQINYWWCRWRKLEFFLDSICTFHLLVTV